MPTYDFRCPACEMTFEERRSFARADDPAVCPCCGDDHASKVIAAAAFYSPGSAARALLDPGARQKATAVPHPAACPCCSPRQSAVEA
jgi:putative FmdB family regulatory protein